MTKKLIVSILGGLLLGYSIGTTVVLTVRKPPIERCPSKPVPRVMV